MASQDGGGFGLLAARHSSVQLSVCLHLCIILRSHIYINRPQSPLYKRYFKEYICQETHTYRVFLFDVFFFFCEPSFLYIYFNLSYSSFFLLRLFFLSVLNFVFLTPSMYQLIPFLIELFVLFHYKVSLQFFLHLASFYFYFYSILFYFFFVGLL